jgi:hypothetical protein
MFLRYLQRRKMIEEQEKKQAQEQKEYELYLEQRRIRVCTVLYIVYIILYYYSPYV